MFLRTIGVLSFIVQPALAQGYVSVLKFADSRAVELAGAEMAGVALATVLLAVLGERVNWRSLTLVSIVLGTVGDLGIWIAPGLFAAVGLELVFLAFAALTASALGALYLAERWSRAPAIALGVGGGAVCIALLHGPLSPYTSLRCAASICSGTSCSRSSWAPSATWTRAAE